jgi:hypothetical protein
MLFCAVQDGFSAGPMRTTSRKALPTNRRRRRGSTSPPLANIEPNPGPNQPKTSRRARKSRRQPLDHNLREKDKKELKALLDQKLPLGEIVKRTGLQYETVDRWGVRYEETDMMETSKSPGRPCKKAHGKKVIAAGHKTLNLARRNEESRWTTRTSPR